MTQVREQGFSYKDETANRVIALRGLEQVEFLLPYLKPGMRLLDVGCGPGTITAGLAGRVAPGEVVGLDIEPVQVERGRALAAERGIENLRFEAGDARSLPYPDASFDVVHASAVLSHLPDPMTVLKEFRRVVRPGGFAAVRDPLQSTYGISIADAGPGVVEFGELLMKYMQLNESPDYARNLRRMMTDAGFANVDGFADAPHHATLESTRALAVGLGAFARSPDVWNTIMEHGWSTPERMEELIAEFRAWGERPDSFWAWIFASAIGWVPEN